MRQSVTPASCVYDSMPHSILRVSYKAVINQVMEVFEGQVALFLCNRRKSSCIFQNIFELGFSAALTGVVIM